MPKKNVGYKEPADYFNADMLKAAKEWDKKHKADQAAKTSNTTGKKK